MTCAIGFDVYGTLVDPLGLDRHLQRFIGDKASPFAALWRTKQLEYSFRKGLMEKYENFEICTKQALQFATETFGVKISQKEQNRLMENYQDLPKFKDVTSGLGRIKEQGHHMAAFSNGVEKRVRELLKNAGLITFFETVVSVDDLKMFKPHPSVYHYLHQRLKVSPDQTWLISANSWDVIGAKSAGIRAAWVRRNDTAVFDPWGIKPDAVVSDLEALADFLGG